MASERRGRRLARVLLAPAGLALTTGAWAGLARLGLDVSPPREAVAAHGALMASGFVGTVIALERSVSLGRRWGYIAPLASGLSTVVLLAGVPAVVPAGLTTLAGVVLVVVFTDFLRQRRSAAVEIMRAGAACWAASGLLWLLGWAPARLALWWMVFLLLTIAGERLELARFRRPTVIARVTGVGGAALLAGGLALDLLGAPLGPRLIGAGMLGAALWLIESDTARRTVGRGGIATYAGVGLLLGYGWLLFSGLVIAARGWPPEGLWYDAVLHAMFLGFVVSAIAVHAPIILPAVTGLPVRFGWAFYVPLGVLHGSVVLRVGADVQSHSVLRQWGGALNVVALVLLGVVVTTAMLLASRGGGRTT